MKDKVIQIVYTFSCMFLALFFVVASSNVVINVMRQFNNQPTVAWSHQESYAVFIWFGVLSLWFAIAAEKRAQHHMHPTSGEATVNGALSTPENKPSNMAESTPPTRG
jgi:TRAP-type C4-dicarboxylate transport system permease small subunit